MKEAMVGSTSQRGGGGGETRMKPTFPQTPCKKRKKKKGGGGRERDKGGEGSRKEGANLELCILPGKTVANCVCE